MKKISWLFVFIMALVITTPVNAGAPAPTGDRIMVLPPPDPAEYPANTPFFIQHGWYPGPDVTPGQWFFALEVDGVRILPTLRTHTTFAEKGEVYFLRTWIYNFPQGMTGQHTFRGYWIAPCSYALDLELTDWCANPNADFAVFENEVTITFVE